MQELQELQAQLEAGDAIDRISGMEAADGTVAFTYTMIPSRAWLEAPEREFPVTIDPDVQTSLDSSQVHDTFISSLDPNENTYLFSKLKVGYGSSSGINRIYIKFPNLPALGAGDMVIKASLNIARRNSNSSNDLRLDVHRVTEDWTSSTLVWNNRAAYDTTKVESISYSVLPGSFNTWDITGLVKQWYDGTPNYGCVIKAYDETWGYMEYHSVDAQYYYSSHPYASIVYVNATGLEDTWTYHSQSVGRAGTISVNDYNGNLVLTHGDVSIASGVMPITLNHVFNTHDKDTDLGYGYGWRLNYAQTATPVTISGTNYYKHIDGDGTAHYYRQSASNSTLYENELDKETTLTVSGSTKTIQDKLGNQLIFNSAGQLYQLKDSNGNTLSVNYNSNGQVTSIVDGANRTTTLSYSGGRLAAIDSPDGLDVSYSYSSAGRLTGITYADNKTSSYGYDANGNLTTVQNYDGYKVQYGYTDAAPFRVVSISEYAGSTAGGSLAISHGWNSTTFTDNVGRKSIYQFNNAGQTVAIRDVDGSAQFCSFNSGDRTVTQLKTVSKLQKRPSTCLRTTTWKAALPGQWEPALPTARRKIHGQQEREAHWRKCGGFADGDAHAGQNIYAFRLFQGRGRGVSLRRIWRHDRGKHGRAWRIACMAAREPDVYFALRRKFVRDGAGQAPGHCERDGICRLRHARAGGRHEPLQPVGKQRP